MKAEATDIQVQINDEENPKKDAPSTPSKAEKIEDPEKPTDNNCLRTGIIIGGVIIVLGIGLLTTIAVTKGKNSDNSVAEGNGLPIENLLIKETENELSEQIEQLAESRQKILSEIADSIQEDLKTSLAEVSKRPLHATWLENLSEFEFRDPEFECFDCTYAKLDLTESAKYFGQVKDGAPNGRGAILNSSNKRWMLSEGYFQAGEFLGQRRQVTENKGATFVVEWDESDLHKTSEYTCEFSTKTCSPKVQGGPKPMI